MEYMQKSSKYVVPLAVTNQYSVDRVPMQTRVKRVALIHAVKFFVRPTTGIVTVNIALVNGIKEAFDAGGFNDNVISLNSNDEVIASVIKVVDADYADRNNDMIYFKFPFPVYQDCTLAYAQTAVSSGLYGVDVYFTQKSVSEKEWLKVAKRTQ